MTVQISFDMREFSDYTRYVSEFEEPRKYDWTELSMLNGVMYRGSAEKQALIERFLLSPPQDQPAQLPAPGEDPAVELQRSFFEIPGFMQPPQRGGS